MNKRGSTKALIVIFIIVIVLLLAVLAYIFYKKFALGKEEIGTEGAASVPAAAPGSDEYCEALLAQCSIGTDLAQRVCKTQYNYEADCGGQV
ncbi:MAG TPA: hypothetical protein VJH65_01165 [Candidatus Nanoarchaeia archaeon]|nr:hypothetical protein [Candidatus Nanoarchaeia archaeon]